MDTGSSVVDDFLEHFGVKGMKWGVRRQRDSGGTVRARQRKAGAPIKVLGDGKKPAHVDAVNAAISKHVISKSGTHALSNKELQDVITRMNLEQQFANLASKKKTRGEGSKFIMEISKGIAKQQISAVGNHQVNQVLQKKGLVPEKKNKK